MKLLTVLAIALLGAFSTVASAQAEIMSVTGINGVKMGKAIELIDPRDQTISYCTPNGAPDASHPYTCVHIPLQLLLPNLQACGIAEVPERGPEVLCGTYWEQYKKEGDSMFLPGVQL